MILFSDWCKEKFGTKVYKLSIEGGTTCPNRDGTKGVGGCIFCAGGSGSFAESGGSVDEQLERAKKRVESKCKSGKYIAYFQSYTVTYLPLDILEQRLKEALCRSDIAAVSLATRPDCLPKEVLSLIERANRIKPVIVELGLQTIHEGTAKLINRGYELECYDNAARNLKDIGVHTVTHLIASLPGESMEMMLQSAAYAASRTDGIKLQMLHIIKGTAMEQLYNAGKVRLMDMEEYMEYLRRALALLPENCVVHRLTGDGAKKTLIAPQWTANKKAVINRINQIIKAV